MSCTNCPPSTPLNFDVQMFFSNQCFSQGSTSCRTVSSAACVAYLGPNLSCSGVNTNDSLETALQKIDTQICSAIGDYSTYQFNCLIDWWGESITQESEFVDAITQYVCEIRTDLDEFIDTTFPAYQASVDSRFSAIEVPAITCSSAGVGNTDDLQTVLTKYCSAFTDIYSNLDISGVTWNACYTVITPPSTLEEGFQLLADQICSTKALINSSILPVFDNTASCLPSPGASDTLVATIEKIKTRLCQSPTLDNSNLTSSCTTIPGTATDLEGLLQNVLDKIDALWQIKPTYSGDFTTTPNGGPCDGITISLATPLDVDRFVAVSAGDASPGTLIDKVESTSSSIDVVNNADTTLDINIAEGDKGDITVTNSGNTWTIDDDVVTFAKIQNINAGKLLGRTTGGSGDIEEIGAGSKLLLAGGNLNVVGRTLIDVQVFTTSGTWTKPSGCNAALIYTVGGGGGGGGASSSAAEAAVGSGGGAGSISVDFITTGLNGTETITIGAGGAGGNGGNSYLGQNGGTSSFGLHTSCQGGYGGKTMSSGTSVLIISPGAGGGLIISSAEKIYSAYGATGGIGIRLSAGGISGDTTTAYSGYGGVSGLSGNNAGLVPGGSGGAGNTAFNGDTANGNAGGDGIVIVYSYT